MLKIKCVNCNSLFSVIKSRFKTAKYCSLKCHAEYKIKSGIKHICNYCNKEFYISASKHNDNRGIYCSSECLHNHKGKVKAKCFNCSKNILYKRASTAEHHFCSKKCTAVWLKTITGKNHNRWKGGVRKSIQGYRYLYLPSHPNKILGKYYAEHRYVCELILGRLLSDDETPHHINGIKDDNNPNNLYLFPDKGSHVSYHNIVKCDKSKLIIKSNLMKRFI